MGLQILVSALIALAIGIALALWIRVDWRAEFSVAGMEVREGRACISGKCPADFEFNTFLNGTDHRAIENIYASACRKLERLASEGTLQSYYWEDGMEGWPGVTTILQLPHGYFEIVAYAGNDSDGVSVHAGQGTYGGLRVPGAKPVIKPLAHWQLPEELLKSELANR